jgi:hypothetical protein
MYLFRRLMNGSADFVNVSVAEVNVSKFTNTHGSIFFLWKNLTRDKAFRTRYIGLLL